MQTTFPRLLLDHAKRRPAGSAMREKEYGIWQTTSWADLAQLAEALDCCLHQAGLRSNEHMLVVRSTSHRRNANNTAAPSTAATP